MSCSTCKKVSKGLKTTKDEGAQGKEREGRASGTPVSKCRDA